MKRNKFFYTFCALFTLPLTYSRKDKKFGPIVSGEDKIYTYYSHSKRSGVLCIYNPETKTWDNTLCKEHEITKLKSRIREMETRIER